MFLAAGQARAVVPSDELLPSTTKGYISIPDMERLEADFDKTQLGQLLADPVMEPFSKDFKRQVKEKWARAHSPTGLTWEDIRTVPSGEVAMARMLLAKDKSGAAIIADVSEKMVDAEKLLVKVDANMAKLKAKKELVAAGEFQLTLYTHTQGPDKGAVAVYFIHPEHKQLVVSDDLETAKLIVARFDGDRADSLSSVKAYQVTQERTRKAQGDGLAPHARWFVEPFGFIDARRIANPSDQHKKKDLFSALKNQGFTAIQGVGGLVTFSNGDHDIEHRTMVYAPPPYELAMRMLKFFNGNNHAPKPWIPRQLASFVSFNGDLRNGFEFSKTLVDELADDEIFEEILRSLEVDPAGPMVNVRKEIVANLGEHVMVLTDYELPITTESERMVACIELTNTKPVAAAVDKIMKVEPDAFRIIAPSGHIVWEVKPPQANQGDPFPAIEIDGLEDFGEEDQQEKSLPSSAVTVAHGYLLVGTHKDLIFRLLEDIDRRRTLAGSVDYQIVMEELQKLGAGQDSCQYFSRTDEEYRATYELIKQGKMPEAKTMTARLLNFVLDDDDDDETLRSQQIDGSKLPDYQTVRRYLGPAGIFIISQEDGWLATGCLLKSS
jgi:hypothetical protein